jgi:hypothetical protein
MSTKQSRELFQVKRFLPILFKNESYSLTQPSPPLPDVVVQLADKRIGIEITTLVLNEQLVQMESSQETILSEAQRLFEQNYRIPLHVTVNFVDEASWKRRECQQVAVFLADTVCQLVLEAKELPQFADHFDISEQDIEHTHICGVSILYSAYLTIPCWSQISSFWVPSAPLENIQAIISRKTKNIKGYKLGCEEVWLLILETGSQSSYFEHFDKLQAYVFESDFAKTLIGRISKGEVLVLNTKSSV